MGSFYGACHVLPILDLLMSLPLSSIPISAFESAGMVAADIQSSSVPHKHH